MDLSGALARSENRISRNLTISGALAHAVLPFVLKILIRSYCRFEFVPARLSLTGGAPACAMLRFQTGPHLFEGKPIYINQLGALAQEFYEFIRSKGPTFICIA